MIKNQVKKDKKQNQTHKDFKYWNYHFHSFFLFSFIVAHKTKFKNIFLAFNFLMNNIEYVYIMNNII